MEEHHFRKHREKGFTLLEVVFSMVAIAGFLILAIDPLLTFHQQKNQVMIETRLLDQMASDQAAEKRDGYQIGEGTWCIEGLCLASTIRDNPPRNLIGPLAESIVID